MNSQHACRTNRAQVRESYGHTSTAEKSLLVLTDGFRRGPNYHVPQEEISKGKE
jgi:hypothetical protein